MDVPLTYGDYYYVEALMRMKQLMAKPTGMDDRRLWVETLDRIARPVLENLAAGTLKQNMPFESLSSEPLRREVSYLEAVGRTICGIAPWLELGPDDTEEGRLRAHYINMVVKGLKNGVNPQSPDHLMFDRRHSQPLVDAAFLAEGILRAPTQIWGRLDQQTRDWLVSEWKTSRGIKPYECNWLLFASIVECALLEFTGECDMQRLMYGVNRFRNEWYKGDGWYGDGPDFHLDYYNSLVIHPMFTETLQVLKKHGLDGADFLPTQTERHARLAAQLERTISPEGTYPVTGRSIVYRFGSFHALADAALLHILPASVSPAPGALRPDGCHPAPAFTVPHFRSEWLAPHWLYRQSDSHVRGLHQYWQPLPLHRRPATPRPARRRPLLGRSRPRLDGQEILERRGRGSRSRHTMKS